MKRTGRKSLPPPRFGGCPILIHFTILAGLSHPSAIAALTRVYLNARLPRTYAPHRREGRGWSFTAMGSILGVVRKQYHFRSDAGGIDAWDVDRLVALSASLPVRDVPLEEIAEIESTYWYDHGYVPTVRSVVDHARLIGEVDMKWPIILSHDGRVMDGMHRVARALLDGAETVRAVRFDEPIAPDYKDCRPEDLPGI